jgi:hypothetical protein
VKTKRTKVGLLKMLEQATLNMDPSQKALAVRAMDDVVHALAVKDQLAADKAVVALVRPFLRLPMQFDGEE